MNDPHPVPPPSSFPAPDTLVLSGGGPDGLAFVGCLRHLERAGLAGSIRRVVGCSAGAIVALLIAAGLGSAEIAAFATGGLSDGALTDVDIEGILPFLMMSRLGVDDGERVLGAIRGALAKSPLLKKGDATFLELAKATGRDLVVGVTNLDRCRRELLSVDTTPDLSVVTAVRMSMSVPFLFTPVLHAGCTYVDGAVLDYCPTEQIQRSGSATSTLVLKLSWGRAELPPPRTELPDLKTFVGLLARAALSTSVDASSTVADVTRVRTVDVPALVDDDDAPWTLRLDTLSLALSGGPEAVVERYLEHGEAALRDHLLRQ
jgi:predicted acylesterase/phospholipase RssA